MKMKQKRFNSLEQNNHKKSTSNDKNKDILNNLYPYSIPVNYNNTSNKKDELLIKKKIFNFNKNPNYITLASSYLSSLKTINKTNLNIKNNNLFNKPKDNSINKSKINYTVSKSIDNSINNSKDLLVLKKKDKLQLDYLLNTNFINNDNKKHDNLSLNKIKINRDDISYYNYAINKKNKKIPKLKLPKKKDNNSISSLNSRENSLDKKSILFKKNEDILNNELKENSNYRKFLFNEKLNKFDENQKEIMEIINDDKIKNKGLFYLYNHQNNIFNTKKKIKASIKYPSFNSLNYKGVNNFYNISNENRAKNKPMMIMEPSINNNLNTIEKINNNKKYNSLIEKNENIFFNKLINKNNIKDEDINDIINKINFKKNANHISIFSKNKEIKNMNNGNISDININNISNLTYHLNNLKKKLKLKKAITSNKTDLLLNNKNEILDFNKMIDKYISPSSSKERKKSNENKFIFNNNDNENIINQVNEIVSTKQISSDSNLTKKESKTISNNSNILKFSKMIEKNDNIVDNISEISKESTVIKDSKYYMEKSKKLIQYIKDYYNKYNKYPDTKINFFLYGRQIGQGAFGKVNLGLNVLTGRVVAIKSFKKSSEEKFRSNIKKVLYETNLMKNLNHPNITKILEVFNDEEYMLIIMEYINGGNLFSFVKKRRKLPEKTAKFLFRQIILGIRHIHSKNIVHRDIKLENILIDLNNNIKICDFGIGKVLKSSDELLYDKCGTPMYMAPEIFLSNKKGYNGFPADIWSSGITLYIMLSGTLPFNVNNKSNDELSLKGIKKKEHSDLQYQIINFHPKKIKNISKEAIDLLNGLLNKNPEKRLTCEQILNHPWLQNNNSEIYDNNKYNLFTKAEMTMLSKTYIDYRKGVLEDLRENFTITNLKSDQIKENEKNISTKSSILDPFNSAINDKSSINSLIKDDLYDDFNNSKLELENDIIIYNNKVKEFNLNYEINNNHEVDNGMMIKTKSEISSSISNINNSPISNYEKKAKPSEDKDKGKEKKNLFDYKYNEEKNKDNSLYNNNLKYKEINNILEENSNFIDVHNPKISQILKEMENFGYFKEYVIKCIKNNILCHATTVYYLLKNYGDIE